MKPNRKNWMKDFSAHLDIAKLVSGVVVIVIGSWSICGCEQMPAVGPRSHAQRIDTSNIHINDVTTNPTESGSRLKVGLLVGDDGLKVPNGKLWDSQLMIECAPAVTTANGTVKCVPILAMNNLNFSDTGCTVPAVMLDFDGQSIAVEQIVDWSSGHAVRYKRVWTVGLPLSQGSVYSSSSTGCFEIGTPDGYYSVGSDITDSLVSMHDEHL